MSRSPLEAGCEAYIAFFEQLSPVMLNRLPQLVTADIVFSDPFNDVRGIDACRLVFDDMFKRTRNPRFSVSHRAWSGNTCYLRWRFSASAPMLGESWQVDGVSAVTFTLEGKVSSHIDFWDSGRAVYARLPVIGALWRLIAKRLSAGAPASGKRY